MLDKQGSKTIINLYLVGPSPDSEIAFKYKGNSEFYSEYYRGWDASALEKAIRAAMTDSVN